MENGTGNPLIRNSGDIGWRYGEIADPNNKDKVKCNFCSNVSSGGINRFKQHIAGIGSSVSKCTGCPEEARDACLEYFSSFRKKKKEKLDREKGLRADVNVTSGAQQSTGGAHRSAPHKLGPIDKWVRAIDPSSSSTASLHQQKMNQARWDEKTLQVQQYIARWVYLHDVPFDAIESDEFKQMCEAIGQFGPGLKSPQEGITRIVIDEARRASENLESRSSARRVRELHDEDFQSEEEDSEEIEPILFEDDEED
ncbi:hypothetical protein LINGRAHAP2_LOCUS33323 [Linum grandiflorum]